MRASVLIFDSGGHLPHGLRDQIRARGLEIATADHEAAVLAHVDTTPPDLVVLARCVPFEAAVGLCATVRRRCTTARVILLVARSSEARVLEALRAGVDDYFGPDADGSQVMAAIERCLALPRRERTRRASAAVDEPVLVGVSPAIEAVRSYTRKVAVSDANVVVTGETGTGKEVVARLVHHHSRRRGTLVSLNCAAIPDNLLESELFGYERGAFTGAHTSQDGKLRLADGGSLFFDEIADMSPYAQAKLLRVIETREVYRLGGRRPLPFDARLIAATNVELEQLVEDGRFRKDLFFRLNVAQIHLPPLRERPEDVPALLDHHLREIQRRSGSPLSEWSADAVDCLMRYPWPGNVRELRNLVELMTVHVASGPIRRRDLPAKITDRRVGPLAQRPRDGGHDERDRLLAALETTNWNKSRAAAQLQWSRMTLYRKMAKYQIADTRPTFGSTPHSMEVSNG